MSAEFKRIAGACLILLLAPALLKAYEPAAEPAPRPFHYDTDSFAFANETVWNYVDGSVKVDAGKTERKRDYTRRCFVVSRAAVQFWKFARFDPHASPLTTDQLAGRIRDVTERSVWLPALPSDKRTVFPGYASLRSLSAANPGIFQANIGLGWPVYFRAGNAPIAVPLSPATEATLNDEIFRDLGLNYPTIVWLYRFPSLAINHVVVVLSSRRDGTHYHYLVYDPNYTDGPKRLDFDTKTQTFSYQPTFYFKGGEVDARAIYRGVLQ
jgi:hypothetical protein